MSSGGPAYGPKPSKKGKRIKHTRADSDTDVTGNLIGRDDSRLVVAGIPDMSEKMFQEISIVRNSYRDDNQTFLLCQI